MQESGNTATLQAQRYVEEKRKELSQNLSKKLITKTNIATDIWKLTFEIRANEKIYMLTQKEKTFQAMQTTFSQMLDKLQSLKKIASNNSELQKIDLFYKAAKQYEKTAYSWVKLNKKLMQDILPR